jgi:hypothetical protein
MASIFGAAFDKLDKEVQRSIAKKLQHRRKRYMRAMQGESLYTEVVLLGDTPGPGKPDTPNYHHTPFYSTKNSSLWINKLLVEHSIPETSLLWFNTTLADGSPLDPDIFNRQLKGGPVVICLGGAAEKWLLKTANYKNSYHKVFHPQAWKRFHSKEKYPLLDYFEEVLDL